jgi:hypothetical protein
MTVSIIPSLANPSAPTLAELAAAIELAQLRDAAMRCPGDCPRHARPTWAEWVRGRVIIHTCQKGTP